jgi:hypothetical protein
MTLASGNYKATNRRIKQRRRIVEHIATNGTELDFLTNLIASAQAVINTANKRKAETAPNRPIAAAVLNDELCKNIGHLRADIEIISFVWDKDHIQQHLSDRYNQLNETTKAKPPVVDEKQA